MPFVICSPFWLYDEHKFATRYFSGDIDSSGRLLYESWSLSLDDAVYFNDYDLLYRVVSQLDSPMLRLCFMGEGKEENHGE